jgi:hypothetical protein
MNQHNQAPKFARLILMPIVFLLDKNPAAVALQSVNSLIDLVPLLLAGVLILLGLAGLVYLQQLFLHKNR